MYHHQTLTSYHPPLPTQTQQIIITTTTNNKTLILAKLLETSPLFEEKNIFTIRKKHNKLGLNWAKLSSNWNWYLLWLRFAALYWWLQTTIHITVHNKSVNLVTYFYLRTSLLNYKFMIYMPGWDWDAVPLQATPATKNHQADYIMVNFKLHLYFTEWVGVGVGGNNQTWGWSQFN